MMKLFYKITNGIVSKIRTILRKILNDDTKIDFSQELIYHKRKIAFEKTAEQITDLFKENKIEDYCFNFGSALSLLRDGYLEPKQIDIDICIMEKDLDSILALLEKIPNFMMLEYRTEILSSKMKRKPVFETPNYTMEFYSKEEERISGLHYFDTLNLVRFDLMVTYEYEGKSIFISEYPFEKGDTYYLNMKEMKDGFEDKEFISAIYREDLKQLALDNHFVLKKVSYRLLKNHKALLSRVFGNWQYLRIEKHDVFYSDMKELMNKRKQIKDYYLCYEKTKASLVRFTKNTAFHKRVQVETWIVKD